MVKLVDEWRSAWRMLSVQAAGVFATILTMIVANPGPVLQFINSLPEEYKPFLPVLTFIVTFGVPTLLRLIQQPAMVKPRAGE